MSKIGKWVLFAFIVFAFLFIAVFIIVGAVKYNQFRIRSAAQQPENSEPLVMITNPLGGNRVRSGNPLIIETSVLNMEDIKSVSIYLNGEWLGEQDVFTSGAGYDRVEFLASLPGEGIMILVARADDLDQGTFFSAPVKVQVVVPEYDEEKHDPVEDENRPDIGSYTGEAPPQMPQGDLPLADPWNGSIVDWGKSIVEGQTPEAPELAASLQDCSTKLGIHDLSGNETGFEVWRLLPNSPDWYRVALLDEQPEMEWFAFQDADAFGLTQYYVSAFNSQGKANSNLVQVHLPDDCNGQPQERLVETLSLKNIQTQIPVENLYCYVSLDGSSWIRRPQTGFWEPEVFNGNSFDAEIIMLSLPGDADRGAERSYYLQCWGWVGEDIHFLGEFHPILKPQEPEIELVAVDGGMQAMFVLDVLPFPLDPVFYPMDDENVGVGIADFSLKEILKINIPIDETMPLLYPTVTYSAEICKNNLPPPFQNELGQILFCFPYPGFDVGTYGVNPQPYFVWHNSNKCLSGFEDPPCKPYPYWLSLAQDLGHEIGFYIYDSNPLGFYIHEIDTPELFNFVIPPVPCSGERDLSVRMWYYDGTSLLPTFGPPSDIATIECPQKVEEFTALDISFDQLSLYELDDDDSMGKQDVEAFGYFRAASGTDTRYINVAPWDEQASSCPDDSVSLTLQSGGGLGCPKIWNEGHYPLSETPLCKSQSYKSCNLTTWDHDNNSVRLIVSESDSLTLSVKLIDWDDASANDVICQGAFTIESQSIFEWKKIVSQEFVIETAKTGSGQCRIEGVITAAED